MPRATSEFVAVLPQHAMAALEQDNFTITQIDGVWFSVGECGEWAVGAVGLVREGWFLLEWDFFLRPNRTTPSPLCFTVGLLC